MKKTTFIYSILLSAFLVFATQLSFAQTLTVTSPQAGANWLQGSKQNITWTSSGFGGYDYAFIYYTLDATATSVVWNDVVASGTGATIGLGYYDNWTLPSTTSSKCRIKFVTYNAQGNEVGTFYSELFNITNSETAPQIFISEYIEGSNNNKAIEIYNGTGAAINLQNLEVRLFADGAHLPTSYLTFTTGTLAKDDVYVARNSNAATDISSYGVASPIATFDGNDAIQVLYNGITCDVFGEIGVNPGTGWAVAGTADATADKTLLRKLNRTAGNINPKGSFGTDATSSEWEIKNIDYSANLGAFGAALTLNAAINNPSSYDMSSVNDVTTFNHILNYSNNITVNANYEKINNIVLKNAGATTFTVGAGLKIVGSVVDKSPTAGATAVFNIGSVATTTGTLIHDFPASGNIERQILGNTSLTAKCYHGVSVPLVQSENPVSGLFMDSYLYRFDEPNNQWVAMGTPTNTPLNVNQGYFIYYPNTSTTYNFAGTFNHGDFNIPYTVVAATNDRGFNLVPNPYPSHIDFTKISKPTDLTNGYWIWDAGNYKAYNVSAAGGTCGPVISIGQAFFIKGNTATNNGQLTLTNSCRTSGNAIFYGTGSQPNTLRITAKGNKLEDEILFVFDNQWNLGNDEGDMLKMVGSEEAPQLSSINADSEKLTLNTSPLNRYETIIPLSFTLNASTEVQFVIDDSSLQGDITPFLIDKKANITVNLRQNPVYTFNHESNDADNRFELKLVNAVYSKPYDMADENAIYANSNKQIVVSVPSMQNTKTMVNVYDMQGKLISSRSVFMTDTFVTEAPLVPGIYVVSVSNATQAVNKKIVITR